MEYFPYILDFFPILDMKDFGHGMEIEKTLDARTVSLHPAGDLSESKCRRWYSYPGKVIVLYWTRYLKIPLTAFVLSGKKEAAKATVVVVGCASCAEVFEAGSIAGTIHRG